MALKLTSDFWGRQVTPLEHAGGAGIAAGGPLQQYGNPYVLPQDGYQRLAEGSNVSMSSTTSGDSMAMSMVDSSVGSTGSQTAMLMHPDLRPRGGRDNSGSLVGYSVVRNQNNGNRGGGGGRGGGEEEDALAVALMDVRYPAQGLAGYEDWIINLQFLTLGPAFAQGAFGKLYRGTYNGQEVAVKILERPENDTDRALIMEQQFVQEVMMLANLRHQNVVRFIGSCTKPSVWCVVTEYAKGGSVRSFLARRQNRTIPLKAAVKQALDVARGMEYLHSLGFIHRDLKSDNLLIATDKSIKIADFGAARIEVQTEGMTPETGTYRWMAPEMIQHRSYSNKVDVYSFGIVLWELITGKLPFQNMTAVQAAFAVVNKGVRPIIPQECPPSLTQIMTRCWDANPDERPPFSQVVKLLEEAEIQIVTTVGRARFRCCLTAPLTHE